MKTSFVRCLLKREPEINSFGFSVTGCNVGIFYTRLFGSMARDRRRKSEQAVIWCWELTIARRELLYLRYVLKFLQHSFLREIQDGGGFEGSRAFPDRCSEVCIIPISLLCINVHRGGMQKRVWSTLPGPARPCRPSCFPRSRACVVPP